jgi:hypothetical protein
VNPIAIGMKPEAVDFIARTDNIKKRIVKVGNQVLDLCTLSVSAVYLIVGSKF